MKEIYLVRHAKSDWGNASLADIERPLNERGYSNAHLMSQRFSFTIDLMITSPAVRANSTALIFCKNLNYPLNNLLINEALYESSVENYCKVIKNIPDNINSVMIFGHNPVISNLADKLLGAIPLEMPTCAIAGIRFKCTLWQQIKSKTGNLILFDYPKKS